MTDSNDENLMSRWSRRKSAARVEAQDPTDIVEDPPIDTPDELAELSEEEILQHLNLPDPDAMKKGDDFSVFMHESVPGYLRKRALRALWTSNPILANVDGLVDYGEDFTDAAMVPEVVNTIYTVGKGMIRDVLQADDESNDDSEPELSDDDSISEEIYSPEIDEMPINEANSESLAKSAEFQEKIPDKIGQETELSTDIDVYGQQVDQARPQRMRFRFE